MRWAIIGRRKMTTNRKRPIITDVPETNRTISRTTDETARTRVAEEGKAEEVEITAAEVDQLGEGLPGAAITTEELAEAVALQGAEVVRGRGEAVGPETRHPAARVAEVTV